MTCTRSTVVRFLLRILGRTLGENWERELQRCTARELKNYVKTGSTN